MSSPQTPLSTRRQCSWTLYFIYFYLFNTNINKSAGFFNFICRYIPLKQWVFDDSHSPKYQNFKIDKLPKLIYYEKLGLQRLHSLPRMEVWQEINLSAAVLNVILMTTVPVHVAMLQSLISTRIMVQKDRSCAKYASTAFSPEENRFSKS